MPTTNTLYDPQFEHDACGVGFIANIGGQSEHRILAYALQALGNLAHRGALDADAMTGTGCGVSTQLPRSFFQRELERTGRFFHASDLAAGVLFIPRGDDGAIGRSQQLIEAAIARFGLACLGWRTVPVNPSCLGEKARITMPEIRAEAKTLILTHQAFTGSARAAEILANWSESMRHFWRVIPKRETAAPRSANPDRSTIFLRGHEICPCGFIHSANATPKVNFPQRFDPVHKTVPGSAAVWCRRSEELITAAKKHFFEIG